MLFQQYGLLIALICAVLAILYGVWSIRWILAKPAGNERMQEIAAAIQKARARISIVSTRRSRSSAWCCSW